MGLFRSSLEWCSQLLHHMMPLWWVSQIVDEAAALYWQLFQGEKMFSRVTRAMETRGSEGTTTNAAVVVTSNKINAYMTLKRMVFASYEIVHLSSKMIQNLVFFCVDGRDCWGDALD